MAALAVGSRSPDIDPEPVLPNDNRVAGWLEAGVLTPRLEIRESRWYPDEADGLGLEILSFAEAGRPAQNPGPLIRARAGTIIRLSVPGTLADSTVVLYGLPTHSGSFVRETALGPMLGCDGYG